MPDTHKHTRCIVPSEQFTQFIFYPLPLQIKGWLGNMVAMSDCIFSVLQFRKHTKTHRRTTSIYDGHRYIAKLHSRRITYCHCKTAYFSHSRPTHCHRCQILSHRIHLTVNPRHICWASSGASTNAPLTYGAHCVCVYKQHVVVYIFLLWQNRSSTLAVSAVLQMNTKTNGDYVPHYH